MPIAITNSTSEDGRLVPRPFTKMGTRLADFLQVSNFRNLEGIYACYPYVTGFAYGHSALQLDREQMLATT